ncbi:hypothetical protein VNI00_003850 [Paramarasmius palmivorus]|uniref:Uncharacterized protein n=1 Tax=Paramarasmius palmivorus TaxID=297713 RepID=A0AAW0DQG6_9AGAR
MPRLPHYDENLHQAVSAWFLGPRAENFTFLVTVLNAILAEQGKARNSYFPSDPPFITPSMQASVPFLTQMKKLTFGVQRLAEELCLHHVPFWNPRYNGHMTNDTTLPGIAGYLTAMLFNPNNVAVEASPLTTWIEYQVGQQLCKMVGFGQEGQSKPWGHITCDGSVANLESMWAARNLKFYPLSLVLAMGEGQPLDFIADSFEVPTCTGTSKLLRDFTTWELLNIAPNDVLDIPTRLYKQYSFSSTFLETALKPFIIQSASKHANMFAKKFGLERINNIAYFTSATKHYSWPKGAAVTGIGESNLINIAVDDGARMKPSALREELDKCIKEERAVYAYRKKSLSFVLHADGAWGAYFCTTLRDGLEDPRDGRHFVPSIALKESTQRSLRSLRFSDSLTVDPHKSGYIQYPAGGLLYRDERMRYLVTWTSPIVNRSGEESMGVYGIEGRRVKLNWGVVMFKPGAAPVATFLSHEVIGLHPKGYGALLGEAVFGCAIMYAHLVTMSTKDTDFIVTPLNLLPAELEGGDIEAQKEFIRKRILSVPNEILVQDSSAMKLIKDMGSDLSINAFAVLDGKPNRDVTAANDLNRRIFERLSIVSPKDTITNKPLFLTSSVFPSAAYGDCLKTYKRRLGLDTDTPEDLYSLINVVMSPFPTTLEFTKTIINDLRIVIEEEVETSRRCNTISPDVHRFIMQGLDRLYLVHLPMLNMANHRYQVIVSGDLPADAMAEYVRARTRNPKQVCTLMNAKPGILQEMLVQGTFLVNVDQGVAPESTRLLTNIPLTNIQIIVNRQLDNAHLSNAYPRLTMPFFLYGSPSGWHIDHVLLASPNIQLNSDQVTLSCPLTAPLTYAHFLDTPERAMQPFPDNDIIFKTYEDFFFRPNARFRVKITKDLEGQQEIAQGEMTLGDVAFFDTTELNKVPGQVKVWDEWGGIVDDIRAGIANIGFEVKVEI